MEDAAGRRARRGPIGRAADRFRNRIAPRFADRAWSCAALDLHVVDRIKDRVNTGGVLVASREVEEALFAHPAVSEVAVVAVPDPKWIEAVAAAVVLRDGAAATEAELVEHARARLAPFKLPKQVFFAESLPKNTAGKLLKRELRLRYAGTGTAATGLGSA